GDGKALMNHLATVSGADVYASTNLTGRGGDWKLEASSRGAGKLATSAKAFDAQALTQWQYALPAAGITVAPTAGLVTTEAGGTATFTIVLNAHPSASVTIPISSSNTGEGTVSTASVIFIGTDWNTPQTITITGVNDFVDDG